MKTVKISGFGTVKLDGVEYTPSKGPVELISFFLAEGNPLKHEVLEVEMVNPRPLRFNPMIVILHRLPDAAKLTNKQLNAELEKPGCLIEFENHVALFGKWPSFRDRQGAEIERYRGDLAVIARHIQENKQIASRDRKALLRQRVNQLLKAGTANDITRALRSIVDEEITKAKDGGGNAPNLLITARMASKLHKALAGNPTPSPEMKTKVFLALKRAFYRRKG